MNALIPTNEGGVDRGIRIVVGLALLAMCFMGPKSPWGLLGLIPLLTGALGSCPLYRPLGISTCSSRSKV